jgi:hypothetical protein
MAIDRLLLKGGSKALATRRREKFMGMADEVEPKRLSGPAKADDTRPYSKAKLAAAAGAAGGAALATGYGAAAYSDKSDEEEKKVLQRVAAAPRDDDAPVSRKESASESRKESASESKKQSGTSAFGKEFRAARDAGLSVFEFNGKKYNTMLAGESKEEHKEKLAKIKEKNEAAYEKKISELAMAKGGAVKKYAKGGMVSNCGASMKPQQKWKK